MKKWSRKKCWPYVATYGIWLFILLLIVLTSKTEAGQPYPVVMGVILSIIAALIFFDSHLACTGGVSFSSQEKGTAFRGRNRTTKI